MVDMMRDYSGKFVGTSQQMIEELMGQANIRIASLEKPAQKEYNLQLEALNQQLAEVKEIEDPRRQDAKMRILSADFAKLNEMIKVEEEDFRNLIFAWNAILKKMGEEYTTLCEPKPEDLQIVKDAEAARDLALKTLEEAGQKTKWFGIRDRAIAVAKQDVEKAVQNVADAKEEVERLVRKRLQSYTMEESLQDYITKSEKIVLLLRDRIPSIDAQLGIIKASKAEAFRIAQEATKETQEYERQIEELKADLMTAEDRLTQIENGTEEYTAQEHLISDLKAQHEELRGKLNAAMVLVENKRKFAQEWEIHEISTTNFKHNQVMWMMLLKESTTERAKAIQSHLNALKVKSDQDIASETENLGALIDQRRAEDMAAILVASERARRELFKSGPEREKKMHEIRKIMAEFTKKTLAEDSEDYKNFMNRYDMDPLDTSYLEHAMAESEGTPAPADQ